MCRGARAGKSGKKKAEDTRVREDHQCFMHTAAAPLVLIDDIYAIWWFSMRNKWTCTSTFFLLPKKNSFFFSPERSGMLRHIRKKRGENHHLKYLSALAQSNATARVLIIAYRRHKLQFSQPKIHEAHRLSISRWWWGAYVFLWVHILALFIQHVRRR